MRKILTAFAGLVVLLLAACGGGGDSDAASTTAPAPVQADVTLTQVSTSVAVTPGETFRTTLLAVSCPRDPSGNFCKNQVPLGEFGLGLSLDLQDIKVLHDGIAMEGFVNREGSLYRFTPTGFNSVWQPGSIEMIATLSPKAQHGVKSNVDVFAADASFDKKLELIAGVATVEVMELSQYAPSAIRPIDATGQQGLELTCPRGVLLGCRLGNVTVTTTNAAPNTEVRIFVGDSWRVQIFTDSNGFAAITFSAEALVPAGDHIVVTIAGKVGSVWFQGIETQSSGKPIAPILPDDCTAVSPQRCKG